MVSDDPPVPCYLPVFSSKNGYPLPPTKDQIRNNITGNNTENICPQSTGETCMEVKNIF